MRSPVAMGAGGGGGVHRTTPNLQKSSTFSHKVGQNGGFEGIRGEVQKVHYWGPQKVLIWWSRISPKSILVYKGPESP